jgi:hypothetical protein
VRNEHLKMGIFPNEKSLLMDHGLFLEGVYKIELDTKTEYEG